MEKYINDMFKKNNKQVTINKETKIKVNNNELKEKVIERKIYEFQPPRPKYYLTEKEIKDKYGDISSFYSLNKKQKSKNSSQKMLKGGNYTNSNLHKMQGGNYPGYCDGDANITQCTDVTTQCGAGKKMQGGNYTNSNSQNNLRGGNYPGYCDGDANITQCTDVTTQCGAGKKQQRGGNYPGYCDGDANITQCTDVTTQCGAGKKRNSLKKKYYKRKSKK